jgi:Mg-chelatase subunit ChlD/lysophospholipase L1-like esterase
VSALRRGVVALLVPALCAAAVALVTPAQAAPGNTSMQSIGVPVMLVVDTSGSMAELDPRGTTKIEGAKTALLQLLDALPLGSRIGMRTYPADGGDCGSGRRDVILGVRDPSVMSAQVRALQADGGTPTAEALRAAAEDLRAAGHRAATIVLVSDGESTCDPPCDVAKELAAQNFQVTVNTVGFQIDAAGAQELQCIADATGGSYTDVADSAALIDELSASQAASLDLDLSYSPQYSPADAAEIAITATIRNNSDVLAQNVRASLVFDVDASAGSPTVLQPLRTLGNVSGGGETRVRWVVYPALSSDQQTGELRFTVTTTSRYVTPVMQQGAVTLQPATLDDAAPWVRDAERVVVLGDSYSSGEGAGSYRDAEDGTRGCHRSPNAYGEQLYAGTETEVINLACSGAVIRDYGERQSGRNVDPQENQLAAVGDHDLVLLTMGGNDIGFSEIIKNCVLGSSCAGQVRCAPNGAVRLVLGCSGAREHGPAQWQELIEAVHTELVEWYDEVLGDTDGAPVVVLPYVNVVPGGDVSTGCGGTSAFLMDFSQTELQLVQWLVAELNRQIEAAVDEVDDPRLYFADEVVHALQPAHTLCSEERWVVGLPDRGNDALSGLNGSEKQELVHPTAEGHAAIARALVRWSNTVEPPPARPSGDGSLLTWARDRLGGLAGGVTGLLGGSTAVDLQDAADPISVPAGSTVVISTAGYAPGSQVLIIVRSQPRALASVTADDEGRVSAEVTLPDDLSRGDHLLVAQGFTDEGEYLLTGNPVEVARMSPWGGLGITGIGALLLMAGVLLLRAGRRLTARRAAGAVQ